MYRNKLFNPNHDTLNQLYLERKVTKISNIRLWSLKRLTTISSTKSNHEPFLLSFSWLILYEIKLLRVSLSRKEIQEDLSQQRI